MNYEHNDDKDYMEEFNVYDMIPPAGTIIGEATEEEMEKAVELECQHYAFLRIQDMNIQFSGSEYKALFEDLLAFEKQASAFWRAIAKRLEIPYEWPIRIDHANGPIYIGEHDFDEVIEEFDLNVS